MSNKLTREVKYLQESDRPKKVEPLSFTEWAENKRGKVYYDKDGNAQYFKKFLDEDAKEYATYLQEFSAEEKAVQITHVLSVNDGWGKTYSTLDSFGTDTVVYLGKCSSDGDMFSVLGDTIGIFKGNLNSGKF